MAAQGDGKTPRDAFYSFPPRSLCLPLGTAQRGGAARPSHFPPAAPPKQLDRQERGDLVAAPRFSGSQLGPILDPPPRLHFVSVPSM